MIKKILIPATFLAVIITIITSFNSSSIDKPSVYRDYGQVNVEKMPIEKDDPYSYLAVGGVPQENRSEQVRKWLSASVKIAVYNASGSGTIIYYDEKDGYAYVQSCGHLWTGVMSAKDAKSRNLKCKVITWYHNEKKLNEPLQYPAEVLYYSNVLGKDCSLIKFKPDWIPDFFPIAPKDFEYTVNGMLHSVGCDGGREVAHYDVRYLTTNSPHVITTENSPRPGRSGGGLLTEDYYVGICVRTTKVDGTGNGLFTPLSVVRSMNETNGYGWLNDVGFSLARKIPIIDRNNPQGNYPKDYIPLPNK